VLCLQQLAAAAAAGGDYQRDQRYPAVDTPARELKDYGLQQQPQRPIIVPQGSVCSTELEVS